MPLYFFACWCLLIAFANSLDPDQARQSIEPDQDSKLFDTLMVFLKEYFEKVDFEENQQTTNKAKLPSWLRVNNKLSCLATCSPRGGGGGGTLIFYTNVGSGQLFGFKI